MEEIIKLKRQPGREIQIEGSATLVQSLREVGLIDDYQFLVHPVIMGSGKRFFQEGIQPTGLRLVKTQSLDRGVLLLCYQPAGL